MSKVQKPMDEEEAAIMARMKQLLEQDSKEVGPLQNAIPSPNPYWLSDLLSSTRRAPATPAPSGATAGAAASSGSVSSSSSTTTGSAITSGPTSIHHELLQLGERLDAIHTKLKW
jgi:hypothetical protein